MNMNIPGFTAEASLVKATGVYASGAMPLAAHFSGEFDGRGAILTAQWQATPCAVASDCKCEVGIPQCYRDTHTCGCLIMDFSNIGL